MLVNANALFNNSCYGLLDDPDAAVFTIYLQFVHDVDVYALYNKIVERESAL